MYFKRHVKVIREKVLIFSNVYLFRKLINDKCQNDFCARQCLNLSISFTKAIFQKYKSCVHLNLSSKLALKSRL
jgi:hypothetical protein